MSDPKFGGTPSIPTEQDQPPVTREQIIADCLHRYFADQSLTMTPDRANELAALISSHLAPDESAFACALSGLSWAVGKLGDEAGYAGKVLDRLHYPLMVVPPSVVPPSDLQ